VLGGAGEDTFVGAAGRQYLSGQGGTDILAGAAGNDTLSGGSGPDAFVFGETGTANADRITDFASGSDKIVLDADVMSALGPGGNFSGGDARFAANSAGMARDASDRIIYETDTRQIWYDSDGSGSAARQLIATLQSGATLAATDIVVLGGTSAPAPIAGTAGNDTLIGSEGNDTIDGLGGNDLLFGYTGADLLRGGDGNDSFVFREMGEANADQVSDFVSGSDKLHLDDAVFSAIGATGNFAADDGRFLANSTGTAQDADDRLIFNTSTGGLYYDADGSATGSGPQLIATLSAEPTATDIIVI
jgi:serralysin